MDVCRLCGQKNSVNDLCNINDAELMIEIKLEKVFKIRLAPEKLLPNSVCFDCIIKIENSLGFLDLLEQTQAILMENLKTQLNDCDNSLMFSKDIKIEEVFTTEVSMMPSSSKQPTPAERKAVKRKAPVAPVKTSLKKSPVKRSVSSPVIRVEDIFKKELSEGITNPETLNVNDDQKNSDGTLNGSGQLRMLDLGWSHFTWKCNECHNLLDSSQSLEIHFKAVHPNKKLSFSCGDCPSTFKSFFTFQNHVIEFHQPYMKFFCDIWYTGFLSLHLADK
jgi:Zinc-finger associated domain (zf-AD)